MSDDTVVVETPTVETETETEVTVGETDTEETPDETPATVQFAGREYNSMVEVEKSYKAMQGRASKAEAELAKVNKAIDTEKQKAEFQGLDADEKLNRLQELVLEKESAEAKVEETQEVLETYEDDTKEVDSYISKHPLLSEYPQLAEQFKDLALLPKYREATLESLYKAKFQPLIDQLGGKKVVVKKKVVGTPQTGLTQEAISKMSPKEYEKHRPEILKLLTQT